MDASRTSFELLSQFDESRAVRLQSRGVGWVLQWTGALAVLCVAAGVLAEFGYCLAAELRLARAARAAAFEAMLPRATTHMIAEVIQRRLAAHPPLMEALRASVQQNGVPVRGMLGLADGDRLTVTLAVPADAALPGWLRAVNFWRGDAQIIIRAERQLPSRYL